MVAPIIADGINSYLVGAYINRMAETSKKCFRLTDAYGVEIDAGQIHILILTIVAPLT